MITDEIFTAFLDFLGTSIAKLIIILYILCFISFIFIDM